MRFFILFRESWKTALRLYPAAIWIWLMTIVSVFPVVRVAHRSLASYFGSSAVPENWLREFDVAYFMEWVIEAPFLLSSMTALAIVMLIIYGLVMIWANGGVIGRIVEESTKNTKRFTFACFSRHGGHLFSRYFRLFLIMVPLIIVSLIPLSFGWVGFVFTAGFVLLWVVAGDLTKIELARNNSCRVFQALLQSLKFLFLRGRTVILYYFLALVALTVVNLIYHFIDQSVVADSGFKIFLVTMIQQFWIFWRVLVRIQLYSALELESREYGFVTAKQSLATQTV